MTRRPFPYVGQAAVMAPFLTLEHLEHGHLLSIEGVALDFLKVHGFKAARPSGGHLFIRQCVVGFDAHSNVIANSGRKVATFEPSPFFSSSSSSSSYWERFPGPETGLISVEPIARSE